MSIHSHYHFKIEYMKYHFNMKRKRKPKSVKEMDSAKTTTAYVTMIYVAYMIHIHSRTRHGSHCHSITSVSPTMRMEIVNHICFNEK